MHRAVSEVVGVPLPYDDILSLRDRMWEISPTLVRYDVAEKTSAEVALAGLAPLGTKTTNVAVSDTPFKKPIANFYQTDPISRASVLLSFSSAHSIADIILRSVTMAQCTKELVNPKKQSAQTSS